MLWSCNFGLQARWVPCLWSHCEIRTSADLGAHKRRAGDSSKPWSPAIATGNNLSPARYGRGQKVRLTGCNASSIWCLPISGMILICFLGKDCRRDRARLISARTKEALRARRASGLPVGRPKGPGKSKLDKHRPEIEALLANGSTQKFIAMRYNSSPANLANWMKKRGFKKPKL